MGWGFKDMFREDLKFTMGFGPRAFGKYPEIIPLFVIVCIPISLGIATGYRLMANGTDVRLVKSRGPPHEDVGPSRCRKWINYNPEKYAPIPELEEVKKDVRHDAC
ncbi:uncharacterized protein LOC101856373 [Aplysia californica]|uniref:Uncharacterized protein LOC101856373 n=1 Tax=Aplysia californica TaxID=6500 RepID=A0ABM0K2L3_APLCA|nr:uncharacterized protein LOC101856373 [Aplysia californica]